MMMMVNSRETVRLMKRIPCYARSVQQWRWSPSMNRWCPNVPTRIFLVTRISRYPTGVCPLTRFLPFFSVPFFSTRKNLVPETSFFFILFFLILQKPKTIVFTWIFFFTTFYFTFFKIKGFFYLNKIQLIKAWTMSLKQGSVRGLSFRFYCTLNSGACMGDD